MKTKEEKEEDEEEGGMNLITSTKPNLANISGKPIQNRSPGNGKRRGDTGSGSRQMTVIPEKEDQITEFIIREKNNNTSFPPSSTADFSCFFVFFSSGLSTVLCREQESKRERKYKQPQRFNWWNDFGWTDSCFPQQLK